MTSRKTGSEERSKPFRQKMLLSILLVRAEEASQSILTKFSLDVGKHGSHLRIHLTSNNLSSLLHLDALHILGHLTDGTCLT
ncbi:hypothetical protein E2C01_026470 [Portunus trituberculatus]|uniref:Uncharacterized protein n=1 Tax=Portunus trituberculatus TaxID=210409 RepID=A0A5B7EIN5_PORTR|nr:hypothetical protein [Portunus trituberculatus]